MTERRALDFALYAIIGVVAVVGVLWYASEGGESESIGKWMGLTGNTMILFGYAISKHKRLVGRLSFWLALVALLAIHLSFFVVVLQTVEHWKVIWFVLLFAPENIAIDAAVSFICRAEQGRWDKQRRRKR